MATPVPERTSAATPPRSRSLLPGRIRRVSAAGGRTITRAPLTTALLVVLWVVGIGTGSLLTGPSPQLLAQVGLGVAPLSEGRWWTLLTAPFFASGLPGYLAASVLLLLLGVPVERRLGAARTAGLLAITHVAGTVIGVALVWLGAAAGGRWSAELAAEVVVVSPSAAVIGAVLALSCRLSALWRRRLRVLLLVGVVMLALYSGQLTDILRLTGGLVGLAAGPLLLGRIPRPATAAPSRSETRVLVALVVAASALGPLTAALAQTPIGPLSVLRFVDLSPLPQPATIQEVCATAAAAEDCRALRARLRFDGAGAVIMSVIPVLLLVVVAEGLRRGRRAAWWVGLVLNLVLAALGVLLTALVVMTPSESLVVFGGAVGGQYVISLVIPLLLPLAVAGLLWVTRARFGVSAPAGRYRSIATVCGSVFVVVCVLYVTGGYLLRSGFQQPPTFGQLMLDLPVRFLPPGYLGETETTLLPASGPTTVLYEWTGAVFWVVVTIGLLASFVRGGAAAGVSAAARAREVLVTGGGSALSYMTTWPGQSYWFIPDGTAAVAYRVIGSVAVTTGDPIGEPAARREAVAGFTEFCYARGWTPCLYSVTEEIRSVTGELGWSAVQVAEEMVLPLTDLQFIGKKWQDVRTALNKATKVGITAQWYRFSRAPLAITEQVRAISEEWVADKGMPEMGFTLGGIDELADDAVWCLCAVDTEGSVHGVISWLPVYRDRAVVGWTLDFMRRRDDGFRGVMEFLIASAALRFKDDGVEFVSLSGAPLARLDRGQQTTALQRVLDLAARVLEPVYGFRSLLAFKAKFQPIYQPLYLAYPDPAALPSIGNAIGRAYLPHLTARQATRLIRRLVT